MAKFLLKNTLALLLALSALTAQASPEKVLLDAIELIKNQQLDNALVNLRKLIADKPDFRLAKLVYADALQAKFNPLKSIGGSYITNSNYQGLIAEIKARWKANKANPSEQLIPSSLLSLDKQYHYAIAVDLGVSRLYLFENINGTPQRIADYYVSMGKSGFYKQSEGDNRTPLGIYFIENYLPSDQLPDKYGIGAYPINYPNAWDQKQGRTGYGIWLHGTPFDTYSRPPRDSEGCIVLSNSDLQSVGKYLQLGRTPVVISDSINWVDKQQWQQRREFFLSVFEQWREDWQSLDVNRYLSHYSASFDNGEENITQWSKHKQRVVKNKSFIRVGIEDLSILRHQKEKLLVVTFKQKFNSNNYTSVGYKRQYWRQQDDGQWRIIFEGSIREPV